MYIISVGGFRVDFSADLEDGDDYDGRVILRYSITWRIGWNWIQPKRALGVLIWNSLIEIYVQGNCMALYYGSCQDAHSQFFCV